MDGSPLPCYVFLQFSLAFGVIQSPNRWTLLVTWQPGRDHPLVNQEFATGKAPIFESHRKQSMIHTMWAPSYELVYKP